MRRKRLPPVPRGVQVRLHGSLGKFCRGLWPGQGGTVPYVNIRITKDKATAPQKAALIKRVTNLLHDILRRTRPPPW